MVPVTGAFATGAGAGAQRPRVVVLTDIGNEPDDSQSLIRFLLYSSDYDVEGILATTSRHQRETLRPELIRERIDAYRAVHPRLRIHDPRFPVPSALASLVASCQPAYGLDGVGEGRDSEGSRLLTRAARRRDARPLWVLAWGGPNCLAQALWRAERDLSAAEFGDLLARLRVYAISDQDDSGPWMRRTWPRLTYIVSPSDPETQNYADASWMGISGDHAWAGNSRLGALWCFLRQHCGLSCGEPVDGPAFDLVDNPWLDRHVRIGPVGALYPRTLYIMEGDSPSFLNLVDNGLGSTGSPAWGGWGGRYALWQPPGESRPIWSNSRDQANDKKGNPVASDQATIWRWRSAMQNDFAARIAWTIADTYPGANHPPRIAINDDASTRVSSFDTIPGTTTELEVRGIDPDGDAVSIRLWQYVEAGTSPAIVSLRRGSQGDWELSMPPRAAPGTVHIIAEGIDSGRPALTRYRRIVLNIGS